MRLSGSCLCGSVFASPPSIRPSTCMGPDSRHAFLVGRGILCAALFRTMFRLSRDTRTVH
eukprot:scaffold766_cov343-Pavlova_lutheri.AAC.11